MQASFDRRHVILNITLSAMFTALALLLPLVTGQIPTVGKMLLPMHIPVILCGFICGPWWGLGVGLISPLLRSLIFGMPPMMPTAVAMAFELAAYGFFCGLFFKLFPKKTVFIYVSLVLSMLAGRAIWGVAMVCITGIRGGSFGISTFLSGAFTTAFPGIILQLALIPPAVKLALQFKSKKQ